MGDKKIKRDNEEKIVKKGDGSAGHRKKFPIRTKPLRMPGEKKKGKEKKKGNIIQKHSEA